MQAVCRSLVRKHNITATHALGSTARSWTGWSEVSSWLDRMVTLLAPLQLGFGVRNGAEAAVNAARMYLSNPDPSIAFLKLDFQNAFNSLQRDEMSETVQKLAPDSTAFPHLDYLLHSRRFGETRHFSQTRVCSRVTLWVPSSFACLSTSSAPICSLSYLHSPG